MSSRDALLRSVLEKAPWIFEAKLYRVVACVSVPLAVVLAPISPFMVLAWAGVGVVAGFAAGFLTRAAIERDLEETRLSEVVSP